MIKRGLIETFSSFGLIALLFVQHAFAQEVAKNKTLRYSPKDGLSFGIVNSITQDNKGFMWFATGDGLNRFDGSTFKVFKFNPGNKTSLSSNYVQKVFKDQEGTIWVSSRKGLNRFDPKQEHFITYRFTHPGIDDDVSNISESNDGNLWISSSSNGFYYFDKKNIKYTHHHTGSLSGLKENSILSVYEDASGWVWVGTKDSGLQVFKRSENRRLISIPFEIPLNSSNRVNGIYEDSMNNVWVATSKGLIFYKRGENNFHIIDIDPVSEHNPFLSIVENGNKELLVGIQNKGLYKVDLTTISDTRPDKFVFEPVKCDADCTIREQSVQSLYLDRDNNTWVGTYGDGLFMLSSIQDKFVQFQEKRGPGSGGRYVSFYGMTVDGEGNLWLGTDGDGIYKTTLSGKVLKHYKADGKKGSLTDNAILYAYKDRQDNLWFGSYAKGLFKYNKQTDSFVNYSSNPADSTGLHANDIRVIYQDRKNNLWVGTNGGGLSLFDPHREIFTTIAVPEESIPNDIRSIIEDEKGNLWIGSYGGGLNYFEVEKRKFHRKLETANGNKLLSNNVVFSLFLDKKERLWIGTEGDGLILYNTKDSRTQVFNENNGLANSTIYAIKEDESGKIWLSTNKWIAKIDPIDHSIYNFDESDGLQAGKFNERSVIYDPKRNFMCFGGTEGWNVFYPKDVEQLSDYKPEVLITGLQLFGKRANEGDNWNRLDKDLSESEEITLKPNQSFSIHYVALNFTYPKDGNFAYKLEGLDKDWVYVKDQRLATYRYLDPGTYTFKVKASNQDQLWSEDYKSIRITILPPWYRTWWAYFIYVALSITAFRMYLRYKAKQNRLKYKLKISQLEALKEKELHEKKLSFFTNISHEFRTPLTLIISPVRELFYANGKDNDFGTMNIVYRNAKRLLSLVDQLMLFGKDGNKGEVLRVSKMNLTDLCKEVFLCFSHEAKVKNIHYELIETATPVELYGDRDKLEIALYNLVSNAFKFTPESGTIRMELAEKNERVFISISDTGSGIPGDIGTKLFDRFYQIRPIEQQYKGGFGIGLYLVKSIIDNHLGSINYRSTLGEGTTFEMSLLTGKAHFKPHLIIEEIPEHPAFLEELMVEESLEVRGQSETANELSSDRKTLLIIDDHRDIRQYIIGIFKEEFTIIEADNGDDGLLLIKEYLPDLVISDVMMPGLNGIELCNRIKEDVELNHIPIILLTASASSEIKLKGIEFGADDYISKPFDRNLLYARVMGILKSRNNLQSYFYNEITLKPNHVKISGEDKEFLDRCMQIVEHHLENPDFGIKNLMEELCMSRSSLYYKIKSISGQSTNSFIRFIRLRKAAQLLISTDHTIYETAERVGIKDLKYFREQFKKIFNMNPSEYVKKFRKPFHGNYNLNKEIMDIKNK